MWLFRHMLASAPIRIAWARTSPQTVVFRQRVGLAPTAFDSTLIGVLWLAVEIFECPASTIKCYRSLKPLYYLRSFWHVGNHVLHTVITDIDMVGSGPLPTCGLYDNPHPAALIILAMASFSCFCVTPIMLCIKLF